METEEKLDQTLESLRALEHEYRSDKRVVKVGAAVFTVLLVAFFGISLSQIKSTVDKAMQGKVVQESEARARESADNARKSADQIIKYETEANKILSMFKNSANEILSSRVIVGTIVPYGGHIAGYNGPKEVEEGWYFCNGAALDREKYADLFNVIGTAFGTPDNKTFNLPDLRGRFVRGVDLEDINNNNWIDPDHDNRIESASGGNKGNKVGSYQPDNIKEHIHQWGEKQSNDLYSWNEKSEFVKALADGAHNQIPGGKGKDDDYMDVSGQSFWTRVNSSVENPKTETRPKNIYINWIIKAR